MHPVVAIIPLHFCEVSNGRQDTQAVQESSRVVVLLKRSDCVGFRKRGSDCWRNEIRGEESFGGRHCHCEIEDGRACGVGGKGYRGESGRQVGREAVVDVAS